MKNEWEIAGEAAEKIQKELGIPEVALVLGSGLGGLAERLEDRRILEYADAPHFPVSTAPGHQGRFVFGRLGGKKVLCMQGRFHLYEGYTAKEVAFPVRVMKRLGVQTLILTNAAGGIHPDFGPGDLMIIQDHINLTGENPLIGQNEERFGPRFFDMSRTYAPFLIERAESAAKRLGIPLKHGVYLGLKGPNFETPAEIRAFRAWGADAVGMSTVTEATQAAHCGIPVLGISLITNKAAGMAADSTLSHAEVLDAAEARGEDFARLLEETVRTLA